MARLSNERSFFAQMFGDTCAGVTEQEQLSYEQKDLDDIEESIFFYSWALEEEEDRIFPDESSIHLLQREIQEAKELKRKIIASLRERRLMA